MPNQHGKLIPRFSDPFCHTCTVRCACCWCLTVCIATTRLIHGFDLSPMPMPIAKTIKPCLWWQKKIKEYHYKVQEHRGFWWVHKLDCVVKIFFNTMRSSSLSPLLYKCPVHDCISTTQIVLYAKCMTTVEMDSGGRIVIVVVKFIIFTVRIPDGGLRDWFHIVSVMSLSWFYRWQGEERNKIVWAVVLMPQEETEF